MRPRWTLMAWLPILVLGLAACGREPAEKAPPPGAVTEAEHAGHEPGMSMPGKEGAPSHERAGHAPGAAHGARAMNRMPPDAVMVALEKQQLIGVRFGEVAVRELTQVIRTVGKVDYDERKVAHVHTKVGGWIEEIFVNFTGQLVEKGQPLFSLYSPDLVSTQEEYLLALKAKRYIQEAPYKEISDTADALLHATRRRLLLWDITEAQIRELERTGRPRKTLTIHSPIRGYVTHKQALEGKYVNPGEPLYTIADLSTVWIYADIYEYELPFVKPGQRAVVTLSYYPGETFTGKVSYVYPYLEPGTRTVKARLEFPNPGWKLKPEMYANVEIRVPMGKKLAIPEEAVLDTGIRQVAFVDLGNGHFQPRELRLGPKVGEYYVVLEGVRAGERVVTSANFLIDSESKLKSATGMVGHQH